jgi:ribose 5-phosphate isomerase B
MRVGIASDHGGFVLKEQIANLLRGAAHEVVDFGALQLSPGDDYPDYVIPLARAVAAGTVDRGVALCGSGVGASICANKVAGVRAGLIHDVFSAHQGVEDDDMNVFLAGRPGNRSGTGLGINSDVSEGSLQRCGFATSAESIK